MGALPVILACDDPERLQLWHMGVDRGRAEGRDEGQLEGRVLAGRQTCADLAKALHRRVAWRALPVIEACEDPETLRSWILQCPKLSDAEFVALVTGKPAVARPSRSRASRPSRRARASKRR